MVFCNKSEWMNHMKIMLGLLVSRQSGFPQVGLLGHVTSFSDVQIKWKRSLSLKDMWPHSQKSVKICTWTPSNVTPISKKNWKFEESSSFQWARVCVQKYIWNKTSLLTLHLQVLFVYWPFNEYISYEKQYDGYKHCLEQKQWPTNIDQQPLFSQLLPVHLQPWSPQDHLTSSAFTRVGSRNRALLPRETNPQAEQDLCTGVGPVARSPSCISLYPQKDLI